MTRRTTIVIVIVSETRDKPSSTFPAAPAIDVEGESTDEEPRPLAKCPANAIQLRRVS